MKSGFGFENYGNWAEMIKEFIWRQVFQFKRFLHLYLQRISEKLKYFYVTKNCIDFK